MGEKWLRYKVCWGFGKSGIGERFGAVECEIEVLYDILAWGVLEKMKIHPLHSNTRKSTKSGVVHFALFCTVPPGVGRTRRPALVCVAVAVVVCRGRWLALHTVNYILTMLPRQHFVQLVKYFYFTLITTTIACTYSTHINYSL